MATWWYYHRTGNLAYAGAWENQPLTWLLTVNMCELVYQTFLNRFTENFKLDKLSAAQKALFVWLEQD